MGKEEIVIIIHDWLPLIICDSPEVLESNLEPDPGLEGSGSREVGLVHFGPLSHSLDDEIGPVIHVAYIHPEGDTSYFHPSYID